MELHIKNLTCGYGNKKIVENISFEVISGEIVCLLGPNGVGKTTFFKTLLGFFPPLDGSIILDGKDITKWSRRRFAQAIAYVPQAHSVPFPFSVVDVIVAGRYVHTGIMSIPKKKDYKIAYECMEELGIPYLRDAIYTEISGGEQQMVLIARALVQRPKMLLMDEPTSNLDFGNQVKILKHVSKLRKRNIAVIMTTHSPDHVFLCGTKVVIFQKGKLTAIGDPGQVVTEDLLRRIYGVDVNIRQMLTNKKEPIKVCVPCLTV